ncbi:MAG TPA: hydrogenase maturation protease, partial [Bacteroidaceae bacterium]|nr:hydrogenase maturation protease [Bacteroidaceae bacterium]
MNKTLLLGLGNDLYGDDGIGIKIIQALKKEVEDTPNRNSHLFQNVDLEACSLTGISLLEIISGYDNLIIVDTIKRENPETGKFYILDGSDLRHIPGPSPHYVSIPQSIDIGKQIGLHVPSNIKIVAVEAKSLYNLGEGLTPEMEKSIPE